MGNLQTDWTETELLATDPDLEPLVVAGYRCHGGFDADGAYHSPRTRFRVPAIEAWQQQHAADFGTELLGLSPEEMGPSYPNVAQARYLIQQGVPDPIITTLTRIGTVEGFGAMIRHAGVERLQRFFEEPVAGTAIAHLDRGLFEAHARDEAGWGEEHGHNHMWFAVRDAAFDHPVTADQTAVMLERMGIGSGGTPPDPEQLHRRALAARVFDDLDLGVEMLVQRMINILLIEISAYRIFAWAEELLSDTDLVAGDGEPARLVSYIRQDESPHVAYLRTVLSEMRDRTFVGESGRCRPGAEIVGTLWERGLADSRGPKRAETLRATVREVEHALRDHPRRDEVLDGFHARGDVRPTLEDGPATAAVAGAASAY